MNAVLTTLIGGLLAIAGGLAGIAIGDRRERSRWLRDAQLKANADLLSSLQLLIRRMINIAYLAPELSVGQESSAVAAFNEATVQWNKAQYGALLVVPPEIAAQIQKLDREVDRLLDNATHRQWGRLEFRRERVPLGRLAAEYLKLARSQAGLRDINLPSIWAWDGTETEASRQQQELGDSATKTPRATPEGTTAEHSQPS